MSLHINARTGEIAPVVLLAGDPLRAKFVADNFMQEVKLVSSTRNIYYFTGLYNNKRITVGASGMGCPSIGIYSYELYKEYNVDCIIRIGTCGAYDPAIKLYDLINAERAYSESTYASTAFRFTDDHFYHQGNAFAIINDTAKELKIPLLTGPIHSGDAFYTSGEGLPEIATVNNLLAAEMEAFALFANAKQLAKTAACLLTVSDNIVTQELISPEEREKSLDKMMKLGLEAAVRL
ncbi:MAG: purine-nucleoside phosphorylase [Chitinophagaceae bacterium]